MKRNTEVKTSEQEVRRWHTVSVLLALLLGGLVLVWGGSVLKDVRPTTAGILRDIGFQLGTVAVLAVLYEYYVQSRDTKETIRLIVRGVVSEVRRQLAAGESAHEVVAVHPDRQSINYSTLIGGAEESIDILTTNLTSLEMYQSLIFSKAEEGVRVRVLTLNPGHEFLIRRYRELGFSKPQHFFDDMMTALRHYCSEAETLSAAGRACLEIRVYTNPPTMMLFRSDTRLILGFIMNSKRSRDEPHLELHLDGSPAALGSKLSKHFEKVWSEATVVDGSGLEDIRMSDLDPAA